MITNDAFDALLDDSDSAMIIRALMIDLDESNDELLALAELPISIPNIDDLRTTTHELHDDRDLLTHAALALSLCPLHLIDYAICFDDDDPDCLQIRIIHPSHDT
jgi:hypothetical protein